MRLILVAVTAALAVTGCSSPPKPAPEPNPGPGLLTVGMPEPSNWLRDWMINHALYTPLIDYDATTGKVTPVGAESVSSTDQITWTIKLKPSRYHDGMLRTGLLDVLIDVPGSKFGEMRQEFTGRTVTWPKPEGMYLRFGPDLPDAAARQAIAMSIDRKALAGGPLDGQADPATSLFPPGVTPGDATGACRVCTFDPDTAKSLRDQAGLKQMHIRDAGPEATALVDQIRSTLGIATGTGPQPTLVAHYWNMDSPHELFAFADVASAKPFLDAAAASGDPQERARSYRLAENEVFRDFSVVPLWTGRGHAAWGERAHGVTATAARGVDLTTITL